MTSADSRLHDGLGLWLDDLTHNEWAGSPGLFLDRDGVIVEEVGYLGQADQVRLIDGAAAAIAMINSLGVPIIMVTNQSGIGRGYYTWQDFSAVQDEIYRQLGKDGAHIDIVAACAYHRDAKPPFVVASHPWRKPNAGMILAVARISRLELKRSTMIGDKWSDLEAAAIAGVGRGILVRTGHGHSQATLSPQFNRDDIRIDTASDIRTAIDLFNRGP